MHKCAKTEEERVASAEKELDSLQNWRQGNGKGGRSVNARGPVARVGGSVGNTMRLRFFI